MSSTLERGQIVFHFCFDIAWETRISGILRSNQEFHDFFGNAQEELVTTHPHRRSDCKTRLIYKINANPFSEVQIDQYQFANKVTIELDDSGALALEFVLDFSDLELKKLVKDSEGFHENETILKNARLIAVKIQQKLMKFLIKPNKELATSECYEDYIIYRLLEGFNQDDLEAHKIELASLIDDKKEALTENIDIEAMREYADEILESRFRHPRGGLTIASYHGAICIGGTWDGIIEIIRVANMELLELKLIHEHLIRQNSELDRFSSDWFFSYKPRNLFSGSLLYRVRTVQKDVNDQLGRIKNPIVRFNSKKLSEIYSMLKLIFRFEEYTEEIKEERTQMENTESIIADRKSSRNDKIIGILGVLVAFDYFTSIISNCCAWIRDQFITL